MSEYAHSELLVSTDWVDKYRHETDRIRIIESDEDVLLYDTGHIPEAVKVDWHNDLQHAVRREYVDPEQFAEMCGRLGIDRGTTLVFYGDKSNWWAAYALWTFKMYGHPRCLLMNGGRQKWIAENRAMNTQKPSYPPSDYPIPIMDLTHRAFRDEALAHSQAGLPLIDVRSPEEFSGERTHMPEYPQEGVLRGGHIPGAQNVPWARAVNADGTFKSREELEKIYLEGLGLAPSDDVIAYCRIGERSSHTWFVLKYLLGFDKVRNYDGSWTEWGNSVGLPIERGSGEAASLSSR